jgi:translation elongation factor EF-Tu-like GTPase
MTRLIVEAVHRISSRPWVFVTGRLEGGDLQVGDEMAVAHGDVHVGSAVVRSIELHSPPGKTTIAVDADLAGMFSDGAVLSNNPSYDGGAIPRQ